MNGQRHCARPRQSLKFWFPQPLSSIWPPHSAQSSSKASSRSALPSKSPSDPMSQARKLQLPSASSCFQDDELRPRSREAPPNESSAPLREAWTPGPDPSQTPLFRLVRTGRVQSAEVQLRRLGRMPDGMSVNAQEEEFGWGSGPWPLCQAT